jgi:hypothetical protein
MIFQYNCVKIILTRLLINYLYGPKICCISKLTLNKEMKVSKLWTVAIEREGEREQKCTAPCLEGQQKAESSFSLNLLA